MLRNNSPAMKPFEQPMTWDQLGATAREVGRDASPAAAGAASPYMTVSGTISKTMLNLAFACTGALIVWSLMSRGILPIGIGIPMGLGLIAVSWVGSMFINSKPQTAKFLGPILSVCHGAWAAFISYAVATAVAAQVMANPSLIGHSGEFVDKAAAMAAGAGLIFQAILLTFGVVGAIAIATGTGILRIGGTAAKVITGMTGAVMFVYLASWILRMFGISIPYIHGSGLVGIGFSLFVVVLASLNVAMSFSSVLTGVENKMPRHYEWVAGYAIVSTVIWLYVEIVILLYKLFARRE